MAGWKKRSESQLGGQKTVLETLEEIAGSHRNKLPGG